MGSRETILADLRAARGKEISEERPSFVSSQVFSDYPRGKIREELFQQFQSRLLPLKGEVHRVANRKAAAAMVRAICDDSKYSSCTYIGDELLDAVFSDADLDGYFSHAVRIGNEECSHSTFESTQIGFTPADALVSRTGSVVLRSTTAGGRRGSVLPPVHCVLAYESQLVESVEKWLSSVAPDKKWSMGTIITGPSRTADIEKILVLGAHGPKRLIVLVVQSEEG